MELNANAQPQITIIGCGPGAPDHLTEAGRRAAANAATLVGAARLLELFPESPAERIAVSAHIEACLEQIAARLPHGPVAVLVTGDPGVASLARPVLRRFGREACKVIPGISSVQAAFARLGVDWLGARILSAHGALPDIPPESLAGETRIAILAGSAAALGWAADVAEWLGEGWRIFLCEDLTLAGERVRELDPAALRTADASPRAIVMLLRAEEIL